MDMTNSVYIYEYRSGGGGFTMLAKPIYRNLDENKHFPFCFTAHINNYTPYADMYDYGICLRYSTSGKMVIFYTMIGDDQVSLLVSDYSDYSTWVSNEFRLDYSVGEIPFSINWFRIEDTGQNPGTAIRNFSCSSDGINWQTVFSTYSGRYEIPNQIGFCAMAESYSPTIVVDHFKIDYTG